MTSVEEVEQIIAATYGAIGLRNENERRNMMHWLNNFATTNEAWSVSIQLMQSKSKEVQFFASNMLYSKVKKEWHDLNESMKTDIQNQVFLGIRNWVYNSEGVMFESILKRLCLTLARITVFTPLAVEAYVMEAYRFLLTGLGESPMPNSGENNYYNGDRSSSPIHTFSESSGVRDRALFVCTELLLYLPEEKSEDELPQHVLIAGLDPDGIDAKLASAVPSVIQCVIKLVEQGNPKYQARALDCLTQWARIHVELATLARYNLLDPILMALNTCEDEQVLTSAAQALVACVEKPTIESIQNMPESDATIAAIDRAIEGILGSRNRIATSSSRICLDLCKVVVALCEHDVTRIVRGETMHALQLVDYMMTLTAHPSRLVAIHTLNFWLLVQDIPLAERIDSLREPCFLKLLEILLRQSQLDLDAVSGDDDDIEYEIQSFRDRGDGVKEPFVVTFYVLGPQFLQSLLSVLQNVTDWPMFEACLFALSAASGDIVKQTNDRSGGPRSVGLRSTIQSILSDLPNHPLFGANGTTLKAGIRVMGDFAKILTRMERVHIERALESSIFALSFNEPVSRVAAETFRRIAVECKMELAMYPEGVQTLARQYEKAISEYPKQPSGKERDLLPVGVRLEVVQGIVRVASCMKHAPCTETLAAVLNPTLERLSKAVDQSQQQQQQQNSQDQELIVMELEVLEAAIRFVDMADTSSSSNLQHPAAGILGSVLPILEKISIAPALNSDKSVVDAMYHLLSTSFVSASTVLAPHLESLLNAAVNQFKSTWSPCCVTCIGKAAEIFAVSNPDSHQGFVRLFGLLTDTMIIAVKENHVGEDPEIVVQFFNTALIFLLFSPVSLFQSVDNSGGQPPAIDTLLAIASECLKSDESSSIRSVLVFLHSVVDKVNSSSKFVPFKQVLDQAIGRQGRDMIKVLMVALAHTAPSSMCSKIADFLALITIHYGQHPAILGEAVTEIMVNAPQHFAALSNEAKFDFVNLLGTHLRSSQAIGRDMFLNFGKTCRKEITSTELYGKIQACKQQAESSSTDAANGRIVDLT